MRNIIFSALAVSLIGVMAHAENIVDSKPRIQKKSNLKTEAVFDGSVVNGKYQMAGGAVSAVENDKTLKDIIGGRKNFKDRLQQDLGSSKR